MLSGINAENLIPQSDKVIVENGSSVSYISFKPNIKTSNIVYQQLLNLKDVFGFNVLSRNTDNIGKTHIKLQQSYKGIPIIGAQFILHADQDMFKSGNGKLLKEMNVPVKAQLTELQALNIALGNIGAEKYMWEDSNNEQFLKAEQNNDTATFYPKGELRISPVRNRPNISYELVYQFDIYSKQPLARYVIAVSAIDGSIVHKYNKLHHSNTEGTGVSIYDGEVPLNIDETNGSFYLLDGTRGNAINTFDANNYFDFSNAELIVEPDNHFDNERSQAGVSVHYGAAATYDYFLNNFGRNSFDGQGAPINSYVHFGDGYFNAFWDGSRMAYGDGDGVMANALVCLDIVGHEITHAVTQYSADLAYQYESGALNESFSDIFGQSVEFEKWPERASWNLADQIFTDGVSMIRSMDDPNSQQHPDSYLGDYWFFGDGDNGGVHYNSGVQNFWYYLLTEGGSGTNDFGYQYNVQGIGLEKAQQIAYRNLTVYLTSWSTYVDARIGAELAAIDLYGQNSSEHRAVVEAWNAVAVPTLEADITVESELDFGLNLVGVSRTKNLTIRNIGLAELSISKIELDNENFVIDGSSFSVSAQSSHKLPVIFESGDTGEFVTVATIYSNADTITVEFFANAVVEPVYEVSPKEIAMELVVGDTAKNLVSIYNDSDYPLNFNFANHYLGSFKYKESGLYRTVGKVSVPAFEKVEPIEERDTLSGYYWKDTDHGVVYDWLDIAQIGTQISLGDDSNTNLISMGMEVPFFDEVFNEVSVGSNGWISFTNTSGSIWSEPLPSRSAPENVIAIMANDLYPGVGKCHYYFDESMQRFIIQYTDWTYCCTSSTDFTMQIQLYESGKIVLLYDKIQTTGNGTVGIQNRTKDLGLTVSYGDPDFFKNGYAVEIAPISNSWFTSDVESLSIASKSTGSFYVSAYTADLDPGQYVEAIPLLLEDFDLVNDSIKANLTVIDAPNLKTVSVVDFKNVFISDTLLYNLVLENVGTDTLTIGSIQFVDQTEIFSVKAYETIVPPKGKKEVILSFSPLEAQKYISEVIIESNDSDEPELAIKIEGSGIQPPVIEVTPASISDALFTGETGNQSIIIDNSKGGSNLNFEIYEEARETDVKINQNEKHVGFYSTRSNQAQNVKALNNIFDRKEDFIFSDSDSLIYVDTLNNFPMESVGACFAEGYLYVVTYNEGQVYKYDPESEEVLEAFTIHDYPYGVAYDGTYLWIGDWNGVIRGYDLNGNLAGDFDSPVQGYNALTFDGQHFLVSSAFESNSLLEIDHSGTLIKTLANPGTWVFQLAMAGDQLWILNGDFNDGAIYQTQITGEVIDILDTLKVPPSNFDSYTLCLMGQDLLLGAWNGMAYLIGGYLKGANWISVDITKGEVPVGEAMEIAVLLDATGLNGGTYLRDLVISSNDPVQSKVNVPVTLEVTGAANIRINNDTLDFRQLYIGLVDTVEFQVRNIGTDTLNVSSSLESNVFSIVDGSLELPVQKSGSIQIVFDPSESTSFTSTLILTTNDPNNPQVEVILTGIGVEPPLIDVSPLSLTESLYSGEISEKIITIDNSRGGSDLLFSIPMTSSVAVLSINSNRKVELPYANMPYLAKSERSFSSNSYGEGGRLFGAETGTNMIVEYNTGTGEVINEFLAPEGLSGPDGLAYDGEYLYLINSFASQRIYKLDPSDGHVVDTIALDNFEYVDGLATDGEYLYASDYGNGVIYKLDIKEKVLLETINIGNYVGGGITFGGSRNSYFVSNFYEIFEVDAESDEVINISPSYNSVYGLGYSEEAGLLFVSVSNDSEVIALNPDDWSYVYSFGSSVSALASDESGGYISSKWLSLNIQNGIVPAGESLDVKVTFNSAGLISGVYEKELYVSSNDPIKPTVVVPVSLDVTGAPNMDIDKESVIFDTLYVNSSDTVLLQIKNSGTDTLTISFSIEEDMFSLGSTSYFIAPRDSETLAVSFNPSEEGVFSTFIDIKSNDPNREQFQLPVTAVSMHPPQISLSENEVFNVLAEGEISEHFLNISNNGAYDLHYKATIENRTFTGDNNYAPGVVGFYSNRSTDGFVLPQLPKIQGRSSFFSQEQGVILDTLENFPTENTGTVYVDGYAYVVGYGNSTLVKYDLVNEQVVDVFNIHSTPYGIAYDGEYLWIGSSYGVIYGYDDKGSQVGNFDSPFYDFNSITYDGQGFLLTRAFYQEDLMRVSNKGEILDTYEFNLSGSIYQMSYHNGYYIFLNTESEKYLFRGEILNSQFSVLDTMSLPSTDYFAYSIANTNNHILYGDWMNGYILEDPWSNNWLKLHQNEGKITGGTSKSFGLSFDATELEEGIYTADISINSNDPSKPKLVVACTLSLGNYAPEIVVELENHVLYIAENEFVQFNASSHFKDPEGEELTFSVQYDTAIVNISQESSKFFIIPKNEGVDTVMVKAFDGKLHGKGSFVVEVFKNKPLSNDEEPSRILLFPNPNNGSFWINNKNRLVFEVYDVVGKEVEFKEKRKGDLSEIILHKVSAGIYYLKGISNDEELFTKKVIVK